MLQNLREGRAQRKKVLALVLTLALALSVAAGAAFTDQKQIKNTEAVDMCVALNIVSGYPDGSFKPEGNITRAEFCKMICVMLNGGKEPTLGTSTTAIFSDVRTSANSSWAEKYIEACYVQGIVSGIGDGKFNPNGSVTGTEAAKMLLVALGYKSENEGFTGASWAVNVNVKATAKGLYEGLESIDTTKALTRDNAAQMVWNALNAYEVEYKTTLVTENGQLVSKVDVQDRVVGSTNDKITLLEDKYESQTAIGQMTALDWNSSDKEYVYTVGGHDYQSAQDFTDLFGRNVKVVYTENKKTNDITVLGIVPKDSQVLATGIIDDIEYSDSKEIKVDGTKYKTDDAASGLQALAFNGSKIDLFTGNKNAINTALKPFYTVSVIDNDNDGKADLVVYLPVYAAQVTSVGTKQITVKYQDTTTVNFKFEDEDIYKGVAKDDYVVVTKADNTYDVTNIVKKMDSVAGKVTALRDGKVQIDGTWYTNLSNTTFRQDGTYTFYVIGNFVCYADQKGAASLTDVLYVDKIGNDTSLSTQAKVYFYDGKSATITIGDVYEADGDTGADLTTGLYTYTESKGEYDLTKVGTYTHTVDSKSVTDENLLGYDAVSPVTGISKATDNVAGKLNSTYAFADDAVVFLKYKDNGSYKVKVVSGAVARSYNSAITAANNTGYALYDTVNGTNKVVVALVVTDNDEPNAKGVSGNYAYVVDKPFTTKIDGTKVVGYPVWDGKQNITLYEEANTASAAKGDFITFDDLGNANIDNVKIAANGSFALTTAAVKGIDGDTFTVYGSDLTVGGSSSIDAAKTYIITKDTTILYVDADEVEGAETGALQTAAETTVKVSNVDTVKGIANIKFVIDEADGTDAYKLDLLVIEVNNEF